jgi:hypothetical protein
MGIPQEDLLTLSRRQISQKYDMNKILNDKKYEYRINLAKNGE